MRKYLAPLIGLVYLSSISFIYRKTLINFIMNTFFSKKQTLIYGLVDDDILSIPKIRNSNILFIKCVPTNDPICSNKNYFDIIVMNLLKYPLLLKISTYGLKEFFSHIADLLKPAGLLHIRGLCMLGNRDSIEHHLNDAGLYICTNQQHYFYIKT